MENRIIATWNTAGLANTKKRLMVDAFLFSRGVSVCVLQESNIKSFPISLIHGTIVGTPSISPHAGLAIWINTSMDIQISQIVDIVSDVIQEISLKIASTPVTLFNIHLPHKGPEAVDALEHWANRLKSLGIHVPSLTTQPIHQMGMDLNFLTTIDPPVNNVHSPSSTETQSVKFLVLGDFNLALEKPSAPNKVWKRANVRSLLTFILNALQVSYIPMSLATNQPSATRGTSIIDYICLPKAWMLKLRSFDVHPADLSDHSLLSADILFNKDDFQPPPYWRFKNLLLADDIFVKLMSTFLKNKSLDLPINQAIHPWWDALKKEVIYISRKFWARRHHTAKSHSSTLHQEIPPIQAGHSLHIPQKIHYIKDTAQNVQSDPNLIMEIIADYYQNLYSPTNTSSIPPPEMTFGLGRITPEDKEVLELPITTAELEQAANQMNLSKAPGFDGLTLEFYLKFWQILGPMLLIWCQQTFTLGKLTGMSSRGILSLICKKGDPRDLFNWRPITLISVDVKIISKALATRLMPVIAKIIPAYQNVIPGRSIHSSLAITRDVISLHTVHNTPLYILALDQAKAFDKVNHDFLFHLLSVIDLPDYMREAVRAIYSGYTCSIKNVSTLSRSFPYRRGVRQGDPISTVLYALAIQPALNAIHMVLPHEGPLLSNGSRLLLSAYADDVTVFLNSSEAIPAVIAAFKAVGIHSEAELNLYKSALVAFNLSDQQKINLQISFHDIPISFDSITILGIKFTSSLRIHPDQWNGKIQASRDKIVTSASMLKNLSYIQRAQWCARRLWPAWTYLLKTLQPSQAQICQLSVVFSEAVWLGGKHWIDYNELAVHKHEGGLSLISPQDKIDIMRVMMISKLLQQGPSSPAFLLAEEILNQYAGANLGFRILHSLPDPIAISALPLFYQAVYKAWDKFPTAFNPNSIQILLTLPAFNSKFLHQHDPPVQVSCAQAVALGAFTIGQLINVKHRDTRLVCGFKSNTQAAINQWTQQALENTCVPLSAASPENEDLRAPTFVLTLEDSTTALNSWSNKILLKVIMSRRELKTNHDVPSPTWKILASAPVPSTFRNQYWRFLHRKVPTPSFYHALGLQPLVKCILCPSLDSSYIHQFCSCPVLHEALSVLDKDITDLGLPPLLDQNQLYPYPSHSHRLANFLVIAFMYTVIILSRCAINGTLIIKPITVRDTFLNVAAKHIVFFARQNPPSNLDGRFKWLIYTHMNLIAKIDDHILQVRTSSGFKTYSETTFTLT